MGLQWWISSSWKDTCFGLKVFRNKQGKCHVTRSYINQPGIHKLAQSVLVSILLNGPSLSFKGKRLPWHERNCLYRLPCGQIGGLVSVFWRVMKWIKSREGSSQIIIEVIKSLYPSPTALHPVSTKNQWLPSRVPWQLRSPRRPKRPPRCYQWQCGPRENGKLDEDVKDHRFGTWPFAINSDLLQKCYHGWGSSLTFLQLRTNYLRHLYICLWAKKRLHPHLLHYHTRSHLHLFIW